MKRLVDSSASELSRTLLRAGIEERPPAQGRLRLLVSLGLVGGITLATSKAIAWFATTSGKLTVIAAGVAMTGGATLYATSASNKEAPSRAHSAQGAEAPRQTEPSLPEPVPGASKDSESESAVVGEASEPDSGAGKVAEQPLSVPPEVQRSAARKRRKRPGRRRVARGASEVVPPASAPQSAPSLEDEVRLVDEIRLAVEAGSGAQGVLVERYRRLYPNGQLAVEVERLSAPEN